MQYRRVGNSGLIVSRIGFGGGSLGVGETLPGLRKNLGKDAAARLVAESVDRGITLFDTADAYVGGQSESLLGEALVGRRQDIVLCSKGGLRVGRNPTDAGLSRRHLIEAAEASLKRLRTDWIDLYYLHTIDPLTPLEETMRACEALIDSGKVRYIALSNWPAWMSARFVTMQETRGFAPAIASQLYYSLVGRDIEREIVPLAQATGLGVLVWSPLAGGFLTGKYTRENPTPQGARRSTFSQPPIDLEVGYRTVDALVEIAAVHGCSPGQVALAWLLAKPFVTSVVVGISREGQLAENVAAVDVTLEAEEVARLDAITAPAPAYPQWILDMVPDPTTKGFLGL